MIKITQVPDLCSLKSCIGINLMFRYNENHFELTTDVTSQCMTVLLIPDL